MIAAGERTYANSSCPRKAGTLSNTDIWSWSVISVTPYLG